MPVYNVITMVKTTLIRENAGISNNPKKIKPMDVNDGDHDDDGKITINTQRNTLHPLSVSRVHPVFYNNYK